MNPEFFDGSLDLHSLQNEMNYYEALNGADFTALLPLRDPATTTATGTHNFNQGNKSARTTRHKSLQLSALGPGQDFEDARTTGDTAKPALVFAFNAPQIYVSDTPCDVIAFRLP